MDESDKETGYSNGNPVMIPSTPNTSEHSIQHPRKSGPLGSVPTTQFMCPICGRAFTTQNGLSIHRGIAHRSGKKVNKKHSSKPSS